MGLIAFEKPIKSKKEFFIIKGLAAFDSPDAIIKSWNRRQPTDAITERDIKYYQEKRKAEIAELKRDVVSKGIVQATDIAISHERVRLERYEDLYWKSRKIKGDGPSEIKCALDCLRAAREETKGEDGGAKTFLQFNQFNNLSDDELIAKKKELEKQIIDMNKMGDSYGQEQSQ